MILLRIVAALTGISLVVAVILSAVRTFIVPRAVPAALSRVVFLAVRWLFTVSAGRSPSYARLDRRMAFYAPIALLVLPAVWLAFVAAGYALVYIGLGESGWAAGAVSGSSLFTLGFDPPRGGVATAVSFTEAGLGIALLALLITYLPTIYAAFTRREQLVSLLEVRAGDPPWAVTMLERYHRIGLLDRADELWERGERWFADIEESHSSLSSLAFFRSPQPGRSWVTAAGAILDGAALTLAALDVESSPHAALCVRSGFLALRRIADFFAIDYESDPAPTDPISITRDEFDEALDRLAAIGAPLKPDREQAWRDFQGWRVNYDTVLLTLASLVVAAPAPWSSDRSLAHRRPPVLTFRTRTR